MAAVILVWISGLHFAILLQFCFKLFEAGNFVQYLAVEDDAETHVACARQHFFEIFHIRLLFQPVCWSGLAAEFYWSR